MSSAATKARTTSCTALITRIKTQRVPARTSSRQPPRPRPVRPTARPGRDRAGCPSPAHGCSGRRGRRRRRAPPRNRNRIRVHVRGWVRERRRQGMRKASRPSMPSSWSRAATGRRSRRSGRASPRLLLHLGAALVQPCTQLGQPGAEPPSNPGTLDMIRPFPRFSPPLPWSRRFRPYMAEALTLGREGLRKVERPEVTTAQ